jgi:putative membrane protein
MGGMIPEITAFVAAYADYMTQLGAALGLYIGGLIVYVLMTPHKELALIREGNASAALAFGAVVVGLAIPMAACLEHAASVWDVLIWGVVMVLMQLLAFRLTDMFLRGLPRRIAEGDVAAAILLMSVKLGIGILMAGAIVDPVVQRPWIG